MRGLLQRMATAAIFVFIMIVGLYGSPFSFVLLFAVITGLCLWEYLNIVLDNNHRRDLLRKFIGMGVGLLPVILSALVKLGVINAPDEFIYIAAFLFSPFIFLGFIFELYTRSERPFANMAYIMLGMLYIGMPFALLYFIAFEKSYFYANTVFGILLLTWMNDTGAYLIGSMIGRRPLLPRISPKKTWEGTVGGVLVSFLTAILLFFVLDELQLRDWLVLAAIVSVFGTLGDLVESMLKRSFAIKDSGTLLPGHGGMLDRFDGFIFCVPFAAAYLLWLR
ncbi:MAG: phosphatidate cytidylyltransferase [Lewinella sp.]|nr:phosphatidate cytidylyltransferase [Lewinella sp.]